MAEKPARVPRAARVLPDPKPENPVSDAMPKPPENPDTNSRLSLPFSTETGKIDFGSMRAATRDKLKRALADPDARAALGDVAPAAVDAGEADALNSMIVNMLYDVIGSIGVVVAKTRGFAPAHADLLRYTAEEKKQFGPLTMKVLNKYDLLGGKYADELMLLAAVSSVTASHVMQMTNAAAQLPAPIPFHAPANVEGIQ